MTYNHELQLLRQHRKPPEGAILIQPVWTWSIKELDPGRIKGDGPVHGKVLWMYAGMGVCFRTWQIV